MKKKIFIKGMTCDHCVSHIETALKEICGIDSAAVDLESGSAVIELKHEVEDEKIKTAVAEAGYDVTGIE